MPTTSSENPTGAAPQADTVKDFIAGLRAAPHGEHVVFGMVKPADTDDGLMVAHPGDCTTWVYLPASAIHTIKAGGARWDAKTIRTPLRRSS